MVQERFQFKERTKNALNDHMCSWHPILSPMHWLLTSKQSRIWHYRSPVALIMPRVLRNCKLLTLTSQSPILRSPPSQSCQTDLVKDTWQVRVLKTRTFLVLINSHCVLHKLSSRVLLLLRKTDLAQKCKPKKMQGLRWIVGIVMQGQIQYLSRNNWTLMSSYVYCLNTAILVRFTFWYIFLVPVSGWCTVGRFIFKRQ